MLTTEDIQKIVEAEKLVFATREEIAKHFDGLRKDYSELQTSVDAYAKKADTYFQEMLMLSHKVRRLERWIQKIAEKVAIQLDPFEE